MERKNVNTTLDTQLYASIQKIALKRGAELGHTVNANDLLEEGMRYIIEKYGESTEKKDEV